jgi:hypothetical protein
MFDSDIPLTQLQFAGPFPLLDAIDNQLCFSPYLG